MTASRRFETLRAAGVDFVGVVPCRALERFLAACQELPASAFLAAQGADQVVAACAGAWLAGARPLAALDGSGVGRCLDGLCSLGLLGRLPLPILLWSGDDGQCDAGPAPPAARLQALLRAFGVSWREARPGGEEEEAAWLTGRTAALGAPRALLVGEGLDT